MAAAVSADQECEDGRGEDGPGPPEQIFLRLTKLTKRLFGRESFMVIDIQSSSQHVVMTGVTSSSDCRYWDSVFSEMILTWKPNQLFCLFCEASDVNMQSQAVYRQCLQTSSNHHHHPFCTCF